MTYELLQILLSIMLAFVGALDIQEKKYSWAAFSFFLALITFLQSLL